MTRTDANTERLEELIVENRRGTVRESTDSTVIRNWKWLFVNGCEYESPIYTAQEFLNSCQDWTYTSMCLRPHLTLQLLPICFCDVLKMFVVPSLKTLIHNTCAQTIQCASMLVVLVGAEAISNHLFVVQSYTGSAGEVSPRPCRLTARNMI